jgi:prepilin-type N-terminal cleavage/methylation domain-containing protein
MSTQREGFSIVEVVVSMVLMAVILTALAGLTYTTARQSVRNGDNTTLQAASLGAVNRFSALPYSTLTGAAGCDTVGVANNRFQRCVTVTQVSGARNVQVVTRALQRSTNLPPTTVSFTRVAPSTGNPLCLGC